VREDIMRAGLRNEFSVEEEEKEEEERNFF
jgi:hypothetical protein